MATKGGHLNSQPAKFKSHHVFPAGLRISPMSSISARIDFQNPGLLNGPRLRHIFNNPKEILVASGMSEVCDVLDAVEVAARKGFWCVGYIRYEAASAFDIALCVHHSKGPLIWFAVYETALQWVDQEDYADSVQVQWRSSCSISEFNLPMEKNHKSIAAGELDQLNFTAPNYGRLICNES